MDPYQVLGVGPGATMDEVEDAYRRLLRAHHPDLHQGASPEDLAEAGARTRELNEAMAVIRGGWQPVPGGRSGRWDDEFRYAHDTDWFGNPVGPRRSERVDCPICTRSFTDPLSYRNHLARAHHLTADSPSTPPAPRRDRLHWLTFLPAPTFWLVFAVILFWIVVVKVIPWPYEIGGIWIGVVAFGYLYHRAIRDRKVW